MEYFDRRELVFIGMICVMTIVVVWVVNMTAAAIAPGAPGLKSMTAGFFGSIVIAIGLAKVKKVGTLSLIGITTGLFHGFISPAVPILFPSSAIGGIFGDIITKLLRGDYSSRKLIILACANKVFAGTLIIFILMILFGFPRAIMNPFVILAISAVCSILGAAGGYIGTSISGELKKAGVIQ
ncbi:MAG: MptD family putative ECF transporter S component [Actinomycetota bacterium]